MVQSPVIKNDLNRRILVLDGNTESPELESVLRALDSLKRVAVLNFLADEVASVNAIAAALGIPMSTAALHVDILERSGLIRAELEPASRGLRKVCTRMYDQVLLDLPVP